MDGCEIVETEEVVDGLAENDRLSGGQANSAGVGDIDGDGEESLVKGGEYDALLSGEGLKAIVGTEGALLAWSYMMTYRQLEMWTTARSVQRHEQESGLIDHSSFVELCVELGQQG